MLKYVCSYCTFWFKTIFKNSICKNFHYFVNQNFIIFAQRLDPCLFSNVTSLLAPHLMPTSSLSWSLHRVDYLLGNCLGSSLANNLGDPQVTLATTKLTRFLLCTQPRKGSSIQMLVLPDVLSCQEPFTEFPSCFLAEGGSRIVRDLIGSYIFFFLYFHQTFHIRQKRLQLSKSLLVTSKTINNIFKRTLNHSYLPVFYLKLN